MILIRYPTLNFPYRLWPFCNRHIYSLIETVSTQFYAPRLLQSLQVHDLNLVHRTRVSKHNDGHVSNYHSQIASLRNEYLEQGFYTSVIIRLEYHFAGYNVYSLLLLSLSVLEMDVQRVCIQAGKSRRVGEKAKTAFWRGRRSIVLGIEDSIQLDGDYSSKSTMTWCTITLVHDAQIVARQHGVVISS
jgi:hypothetical protein